jgi:hypothetical protein
MGIARNRYGNTGCNAGTSNSSSPGDLAVEERLMSLRRYLGAMRDRSRLTRLPTPNVNQLKT